jgi:hypothetical protein
MAFGRTQPITDAAEKRVQMGRLIDRKFPGRTSELRPIHDHEIDQITVIRMPIDEATAKVKADGVLERGEEDYEIATWAGVIPIGLTIGAAVPDERLLVNPCLPANVAEYAEGRRPSSSLRGPSRSDVREGARGGSCGVDRVAAGYFRAHIDVRYASTSIILCVATNDMAGHKRL